MKEKDYAFEITLKLNIDVPATSEKEARSMLTEEVSNYFSTTEVEINKKEAKLISVTNS